LPRLNSEMKRVGRGRRKQPWQQEDCECTGHGRIMDGRSLSVQFSGTARPRQLATGQLGNRGPGNRAMGRRPVLSRLNGPMSVSELASE
jgi:hypothetical protein